MIKRVKLLSLICVLCMMFCACSSEKTSEMDILNDLMGDNDYDLEDVLEELDDSDIFSESAADLDGLDVEYTVTENVYNANDTYKQIAIFGLASNDVWSRTNRTTGIMVVTINENNGNVDITNIQDYTYLNVCDELYTKANAAYSKGGAVEAINMLNRNFDLNVTDCITIGFDGVISLADSLGGVQVDIDDKELEALNGDANKHITDEMDNNFKPVESTGRQLLDGVQTATYCLGRLYGAEHTVWVAERQQEVFLYIVNSMRNLDSSSVDTICKNLYENHIYTSMTYDEYKGFIDAILNKGINQKLIIPTEDLSQSMVLGSKGSCMCPVDLVQNVQLLHSKLFGKSDYQPSQTVIDISKKISEDMKEYQ